MAKTSSKKQLVTTLREAGDVFKLCSKKAKLLSTLSWQPEVSIEFFKKNATELPKPTYVVDKKQLEDLLEQLKKLEPKIKGDHPVLLWLQRNHQSYERGVRLLLELEKPAFYEICTQIYGNSKSRLFNGEIENLALADAIASRLQRPTLNDIQEHSEFKNAEQFAFVLEERLKNRFPMIPVRVELSDQIVAKVVAGMSRIRIRKDARFVESELDALWNHEIESHCLTAHNGSRQDICDFLVAGGPRTTMTQEGLAVFYEVFGHSMSQRRFMALCDRIKATAMAEEGADFLQVYRWYLEHSENPMEAFYATQRIYRGAKITGGAPFTKDVVYLAGLLGVYNFLRIAVKNQNRILVETLLCGRMALEDVGTVAWLRTHGLVNPPFYIPNWVRNWEALLSFFSLTAVFASVDLSSFQTYFDEHYTLEDWDLSP